jgi:hypothetical protein
MTASAAAPVLQLITTPGMAQWRLRRWHGDTQTHVGSAHDNANFGNQDIPS